jgi:acyl-coenzyme A synthetase/AMP-(fatty) acid ligase
MIVPLTTDTLHDHEYFFESSLVDWVVQFGEIHKREHSDSSPLLEELRKRSHPGLVLFSTGTTGRPRAILHDLEFFLQRFNTPRPTLRTLGFLLFDHIGGLNTLLHTAFNTGVVVATKDRSISGVLSTCEEYSVEALPTTPTFLRMMLISGAVPDQVPSCLKIITYGTECMDQPTLTQLCSLLPDADFRQTLGMSELGIVRAKSMSRDSSFMRIGGEG